MELFIETLTGTGFELRVSPMETVMSVKAKIQRLEGIPVSQQHLIWRSEELADDCLLQDYKITDGAKLRLVISMRGGPINTRRVPVEDPTWKEIVDYMESNREEIWEKLPYGRQVTLLVYRDGDQVNFFRVMDRGDGTVVPLSQALGTTSLRSVAAANRVEDAEQQRIRENNVTMQKMRSIRKQMEALTLNKKSQDSGSQQAVPSAPYGSLPVAKTRSVYPHANLSRPLRLPPVPGGSRMPFSPHQPTFPPRTTGPSSVNSGGASAAASGLPRRTPLINVVSARPGRMTQPPRGVGETPSLLRRPGHKAEAEEGDVVRVSAHECRGALPDLRTIPSLHGDGGLLRVETGCGPSGGSGGDLEAPRWTRSSGSVRGNGAVALGMLSSPSAASDLSTRRRLRNPPAHPKSRGAVGGGATAASPNFDSLEQLQLQTLAKFDPRISVQTSPRASAATRVSLASPAGGGEAATLTAIGRRRDSLALMRGAEVGGARPKSSPSDEAGRRSSASTVDDDDDDEDVSSGAYSVGPRRSPLASPETGGSSLSSSHCNLARPSRLTDGVEAFHWKGCGTSIEPGWGDSARSSRETSAESGSLGEMNVITKDSSSFSSSSSVDGSPSQGLVAVARLPVIRVPPPPARKSETPRCLVCRRKTGLATSYSCRCGGNFCATHRYAETHGCTYDYKTEGRKMIAQSNPLVTASKLPKI